MSTDDSNSSAHIKEIPYSIIELSWAGLGTVLQLTIFRIFLNEDFIMRLLPSFSERRKSLVNNGNTLLLG